MGGQGWKSKTVLKLTSAISRPDVSRTFAPVLIRGSVGLCTVHSTGYSKLTPLAERSLNLLVCLPGPIELRYCCPSENLTVTKRGSVAGRQAHRSAAPNRSPIPVKRSMGSVAKTRRT